MSTLIITIEGDVHADAVRWALASLGHHSVRWLPETLESATATARLSNEELGVALAGPSGEGVPRDLRSVWLRRFRPPRAGDAYAPGDRIIAERESEAFLRGLHAAIGRGALWANPAAAQRHASLKTVQLVAARSAQLSIPRTVMTNDMDQVRALLRASAGRVIHKGFFPAVWRGEAGEAVLQTSLVTEEDLTDPEMLRLSPGIFQEFVPKRAELRVMVFGRTCIAAEITEQDEVDWRTTHAMRIAPYVLPTAVEAKLFALFDALGLAMGIVDLIVTPQGDHVFLEVNEQGQFLWVEAMNPEIALLEPFARFLASGDPTFRWQPGGRPTVDYRGYVASDAARRFAEGELRNRHHGGLVVPDGQQPQGETV